MQNDSIQPKIFDGLDEPLWPHELRISDPIEHQFWLKSLNKGIRFTTNTLKYIAIFSFFILLVDVAVGVFFRYVLDSPLTWSESLALWFLIWMSFAGATYPLEKGTHYTVEFFAKKFPKPFQLWMAIVMNILVLFFCIVIFYTGIWLCLDNIKQLSPALRLPYAIPYSSIPIGFFVICIIVIRDLCELLLNFRWTRNRR